MTWTFPKVFGAQMQEPNFVDQYLAGQVKASDVYKFIAKWREGDLSCPLHAFLGMSSDEYHRWMDHPFGLPVILHERYSRTVSMLPPTSSSPENDNAEIVGLLKQIKDQLNYIERVLIRESGEDYEKRLACMFDLRQGDRES